MSTSPPCISATAIDIDLAELYPTLLTRSTNRNLGTPSAIAADHDEPASRRSPTQEVHESMSSRTAPRSSSARSSSPSPTVCDTCRRRLHHEMMSELRWPGEPLETGIDIRTLELDSTDLSKLAVARRADVMKRLASWNAGNALGEVTHGRVVLEFRVRSDHRRGHGSRELRSRWGRRRAGVARRRTGRPGDPTSVAGLHLRERTRGLRQPRPITTRGTPRGHRP